jgi:hypothetical protein
MSERATVWCFSTVNCFCVAFELQLLNPSCECVDDLRLVVAVCPCRFVFVVLIWSGNGLLHKQQKTKNNPWNEKLKPISLWMVLCNTKLDKMSQAPTNFDSTHHSSIASTVLFGSAIEPRLASIVHCTIDHRVSWSHSGSVFLVFLLFPGSDQRVQFQILWLFVFFVFVVDMFCYVVHIYSIMPAFFLSRKN